MEWESEEGELVTEVLRVEQDDNGGYTAFMYGKAFAICEPPSYQVESGYIYSEFVGRVPVGNQIHIEIRGYELPLHRYGPRKHSLPQWD